MGEKPMGEIVYKDSYVTAEVDSVKDAKVSIKELKLKKKELGIKKKEVSSQIAEIRAAYRIKSANQGPMVRGGGKVGGFFRFFQRAGRHADRSGKENSIAPLEDVKTQIDYLINSIDKAIVALERYIVTNS